MTPGEVAAVIAAVASAVLVVGVLFGLAALVSTLRVVRSTVEELRRELVPLLLGMRTTLAQANAELGRVDEVLGRAESIGGTIDSASRLAYLAFSNPLIKALAFATGTGRLARRLRRRRDEG